MHIEKDGVLIYRTHWFILLRKIIIPTVSLLLLIIFLIFVVGLWWVYQYVDWANDLYIITEDQIIDIYKKPLGTEQRRTAQIKNILSVEFERIGFIGLIFNFGTVYIRVGEEEFTFDNVFNPSLVQREIFQRLSEKTRKERQSGRMTQWQDIADFFVLNEGITEDQIIQTESEENDNELYVEDLELFEEDDEDDQK
jgi:hypothetical protein